MRLALKVFTGVGATTAKLDRLLEALTTGKTIAEAADHGDLMGLIFKAASRIDELFFADANRPGSGPACV